MTHAEAVQAAERAVVEAAIAQSYCTEYHGELECVRKRLHPAVYALLALRAATCPTCGGSGEKFGGYDGFGEPVDVPCPAGCDHGRKVGA